MLKLTASFLVLAPLAAYAQLNQLAQAAGKTYFGSATDNPELTDTAYVAILSNFSQFGQITPGNSMKWDATEPVQGEFNFTGGQQIVDLAQGNNQIIRGHNCVWYNQLPSWVTSTAWTPEELTSVIQTHCGTIVEHWAGQLEAWDVVNEPFSDSGGWRDDVFYDTLGESFVTIALESAAGADNISLKFINEYNIEYAGIKSDLMQELVTSLLANGTTLDAVGFQCHFIVGEVPTDFQSQLELFVGLGVKVAITELDIRMTLPSTDALLQQQETDYQNVITACMAVDGCIGITVWDYTDKYSWVPSTFPGQGAACPWDENLETKPAYDGIVSALSSSTSTASASISSSSASSRSKC